MFADGSSPENLSAHPSEDQAPSWAPEGLRIAFVSDRDGNEEIYSMFLDGSSQGRLTTDTVPDYAPAWSADGQVIAFHRDESNSGREIYVMNVAEMVPLRLTDTGDNAFPDWDRIPTTCSNAANISADEDGPVSGPVHGLVEPLLGPAQPIVH